MSSQNKKEHRYSKKILKILSKKPAISLLEIRDSALGAQTAPKALSRDKEERYAISRSLKNLVEAGHAELRNSDNQKFVKITPLGKSKLNTMLLESEDALVPRTWDGFWRIILLDLPENRKSKRESLRYLLKKAGFVCLKNSAWISPYPYEYLFTNIKKDLGLTTEMMIIVTDKLDDETKTAFMKAMK